MTSLWFFASFVTLFAFPRGLMNRTAHKSFFVISALVVSLAAVLLAARAQNPAQAAVPSGNAHDGASAATAAQTGPAAPKTAAQQYKNIQVWKDAPADKLIPGMQFITASLGVDCEYCHVEHAFDKDDKKPKVMARKMMEMMITINNENFESHRMVTCYTCHQGGAHPVSIPVVAEHENKPAMMEGSVTSATGNPAPDSLLDQYLAAGGGADALKKIKSRVAKGTVTAFGDQHIPIDIYSKAPDMRGSVMHMQECERGAAYSGKGSWLRVPGREHTMKQEGSFVARQDLNPNRCGDRGQLLKDSASEFAKAVQKAVGGSKVNRRHVFSGGSTLALERRRKWIR